MKKPILDFANEYASSDTARFHMPGHKGATPEGRLDITEIKGADSLYEANGIILESEKNAAKLFGTKATFYSVEGSSQCVKAMLALVSKWRAEKERPVVLAARNVHSSFVSACALLDLDVEWLYGEDEDYTLCSCTVSAEAVREKLAAMPVKPCAVYLTSPDYLGGVQDIKGIAEAAHEAGVPLLVDNAHGAYLHFTEQRMHPMDLGADMCCDSAHKTLPALTGCAYLHINNPKYIENARRALSLFGSTSPSYLLMESLDGVNEVLADGFSEKVAECARDTHNCKQELKDLGWKLKDTKEPLKITIDCAASGTIGPKLADALRAGGIECEYADPDYVVLMTSPYNKKEDFEKLISAMKQIERGSKAAEHLAKLVPEKVLTIREAVFAESEEIEAGKSAGRILAGMSIFCPPAVPVIIAGERVPEEAIALFGKYGIEKIRVVKEM